MSRYRFEIAANKFLLKIYYSESEERGINWCKVYMTTFQKQVANVPMSVAILAKEKQKNNWEYHGKPYIYQKTLIRKPLLKRASANVITGDEETQKSPT